MLFVVELRLNSRTVYTACGDLILVLHFAGGPRTALGKLWIRKITYVGSECDGQGSAGYF